MQAYRLLLRFQHNNIMYFHSNNIAENNNGMGEDDVPSLACMFLSLSGLDIESINDIIMSLIGHFWML